MNKAQIEQQKALDSLSGKGPRYEYAYTPYHAAPPVPEPSSAQSKNTHSQYISFHQQYQNQQPSSSSSHRASAPSPSKPAYAGSAIPSSLAVGQQQQQPILNQYRFSTHPSVLKPYYQNEQNRQQRQQQQQQQQQPQPQSQPQPQQQQQQPRQRPQPYNHAMPSWDASRYSGAPSSSARSSTSTAVSRLSAMSNLTTASTAPSVASSPLPTTYHLNACDVDESPLARLQTSLIKAEVGSYGHYAAGGEADEDEDASDDDVSPTGDDDNDDDGNIHNGLRPLRVVAARRPVSLGAATGIKKPCRQELRISTQNLGSTALIFEQHAPAVRPQSVDPSSAYSYRSDDYEDYMSPIVAAESGNGNGNGVPRSDLDAQLDSMLSAEMEVKRALASMCKADTADALPPMPASVSGRGPMRMGGMVRKPTADWQRRRRFLSEGVDDDE